jgi:hypothetical protein
MELRHLRYLVALGQAEKIKIERQITINMQKSNQQGSKAIRIRPRQFGATKP